MIFFRDNKHKIILAVVTAFLVILMAVSTVGREKAGILSNTIGVVLTPFQSGLSYIAGLFTGDGSGKYAAENTQMKQQIIKLQKQADNYDKLVAENDRLRSMLELKKSDTDFELMAANIVASDNNNWTISFKLNKGYSDGIKKNDAVITVEGLVGYISNVGRSWSVVTTILDTTSSISAVVKRTEEYCMVKGDISLYDDKLCSMKYATTESSIAVGDVLETSGTGGVFPKGISIGKVTAIQINTNGISQDATVEPYVNFSELQEVFVITNK